jgi:hypothetical protein
MLPDEYQWYVNLVRDRYEYLNLTYEQAEEIHKYQQDKDTYSNKHFFSFWEEQDYELTIFTGILNQEQLKSYEAFLKENIKRYEQSLIEQDGQKTNEIAFYEELIGFYDTSFLPDFFKNPSLLFAALFTDRAKIDFLKMEYKQFLNDTKKAIVTSHFRNSRTYKPNEFKASLLRHQLSYMLPDYPSFKYLMDEATKAVANYLATKLRHFPDETEELVTRKFKELQEFRDGCFKKHYGEVRGWHAVVGQQPTQEEEKENRTLTLMLLDRKKYGI